MRRIRRRLRPLLDRILSYLAHSKSTVASLLTRLLEMTYPRAAARIRFRRGELRRALHVAQTTNDPEFQRRLENMLAVLDEPIKKLSKLTPQRAFNGRILQVFHSSLSFDNNGYAVRSEQVMNALREADIASVAMTRLGYPWDLLQHSDLAHDFAESQTEQWHYLHCYDPDRRIGAAEHVYINAYAELIAKHARDHDVSVIHSHSNYLNGLASYRASRLTNLPCIFEMRGLWHVTRGFNDADYADSEHYQICDKQELNAAALCDHLITISAPLKERMVNLGIGANKISVVGNASPNITAPQLNTNLEYIQIGYIGSLTHYEGLDTLLEALAKLRPNFPQIRGLIIGDGQAYPSILGKVRTLQLTDIVELTGRISPREAAAAYAKLHIAVVPRKSNALTELIPPLKPMEIVANGVPLVASNVAPIANHFQDGQDALLFDAGDASSLAEKLAQLIEDKQLRATLHKTGLSWAQENSWKNNGERYRAIYEAVCST